MEVSEHLITVFHNGISQRYLTMVLHNGIYNNFNIHGKIPRVNRRTAELSTSYSESPVSK